MPQGGTLSGQHSPSSMTKAASYFGRFFGYRPRPSVK